MTSKDFRTKSLRWAVRAAACAGLSGIVCMNAPAQNYPTKPIRFVAGAPAGGSVDILARQIAHGLSEGLGTPVVVDNRAGADGIIAVELVAKSAPDGYTMMLASTNFLIIPLLRQNVAYNPIRDFSPVTLMVKSPNILVVHPSVAATSVKELIALAKSQPGKMNYGAGSSGASPHLAGELFKSMAKVDIVHVPYKGTAPAIIALVAGQVQLVFSTAISVLPHIKSGKLRALAVTSSQRSPLAPDLPTVAESGLPGYESGVAYGLVMPIATPQSIVRIVNGHVVKYLQTPKIKDMLYADWSEPVGSSPEQYAHFMKTELAKWSRVIKEANIRLE
jgi:tripartite-type tricarboxylate transporter receptor subunit TctC